MGAHEGLLLGDGGALLEGLSSNFFAVITSVSCPSCGATTAPQPEHDLELARVARQKPRSASPGAS